MSPAVAANTPASTHQNRIVQRHPGCDLPLQITPRRLGGLRSEKSCKLCSTRIDAITDAGIDGFALTRRERFLEHHIREQILPMLGQELEHAALSDQMTHQSLRVQQLPVRSLHTLHREIIQAEPAHTAHDAPIIQRPPSSRI